VGRSRGSDVARATNRRQALTREGHMTIELLTVNETASVLRVSVSTIRSWVLNRKITYCKIGGRVRIQRNDLDDFIKCSTVPAQASVIPSTDALPTIESYNGYLARGKKYTIEVLAPGGMGASGGTTATAKLKKYFLITTGKVDLKEITVPEWERLWAHLDATAKKGNERAAATVESKITNTQ
jgi:excisionase family DNA binding protein